MVDVKRVRYVLLVLYWVCLVSWVTTGYACVGALLPRISHSK